VLTPKQNPDNPFTSKFSCTFTIKEGASKLQAIAVLADFLRMEVRAARYLMTKTYVLSCFASHGQYFSAIYLNMDEIKVVEAALSKYFDLSFWACEVPTVEFGDFPPWRHKKTTTS
jgi:hypothetical protein